MTTKIIKLILVILSVVSHVNAQSVVGFWQVNTVTVGDRNLTPVAKWFKINDDRTYQSGNGWTQNSIGTWTFDNKTMEYIPTNINGIKDEYGPFHVSLSGDEMTWKRTEDGMTVVVNLVKTDKMPMAPADEIQGLWSLSKVEKDGQDIMESVDPDHKQYIFIRPDRLYRIRYPDQTIANGYWHMDGHNPEFTLINFNREEEYQLFHITFQNDQLVMQQKEDDKLIFTYKRIDEFPD